MMCGMGVRGCHGVGRMNESSEALLSWCALNGLVVMNTMYEKKRIHKYTWQHPGSKQWHCIDHIIMRQRQRLLCCDVTVMRSADCWTDHKLLRAQLKMRCPANKSSVTWKRYAVSSLRDGEACKNFNEKVCGLVEENWDSGLDGTGKWEVIRDSIAGAAEDVLGWETRRQPDWFKESSLVLKGLAEKRNDLFGRWLRSGRNSDRQRYVAQRRKAAAAVKKAKNAWLQEKAREIEIGMLSGGSRRNVWSSLREIQRCRAGLRPVTAKVKSNGEVCVGPEESLSRWQEHFNTVLNVRSSFTESVLDSVQQGQVRDEMDLPPSEEEVFDALDAVRRNKAGGKNGILPELVKCCGANLSEYFLELFHQVWRDECVPQEWKDALIVPIPKKGDLSCYDNWRGISLLDVGGKLFTKLLQKRLQKMAEEVLPDSQCGFRSGRGCIDMVYCVRQLVEKAREHNTQVFMLFIDLRKAYDSIPRQALWQVLRKYGVPPIMVSLLRSLHEGMKAEVTMDEQVAPEFEVCNGLRQGCVIALALFNLHFNLVISQWREKCWLLVPPVMRRKN